MKIGILQTGLMPEQIVEKRGDYDVLYSTLLAGHGFTFETWKVVNGSFPLSPEAADGWLVTGSKHGVYEDHDFIAPLEALIRDIIAQNKPLVGICFGHQIIAQALGGHVAKFEGGWSVGAMVYDFAGETQVLNAWHQDQVITPPKGARTLAFSEKCRHAALLYPDQAYTVQPHPEFDEDIIHDLLVSRAPGVVPEPLIAQANARLPEPLDNRYEAARIAHFFKKRHLP